MNKRLQRAVLTIYKFTQILKKNHIDVYAAGAAFFMFVSIIPFLLIILTLLPYTPLTKADLLTAIVEFLPNEMDAMGISIIDELYGKPTAVMSISVIAAVWSAARGVLAITKGLNEISDVQETRSYIVTRIWSVFYTLFLIAAIVLMLVGGVFGKRIRIFIETNFFEFSKSIKTILGYRDIIMIIVLFFVLLFLYTVLPDIKLKFKKQIPGAFLATLAWWGFSGLFSMYVMNFNNYSMYGSLATIIMMLLWLYFSMYIVFIGAQINYCLTFW